MKWFIKVVRHYADFSGRARRKEYWMFALFNVIFLFVWAFLIALLITSFADGNHNEKTLPAALQLSWYSLLGLPGLAVAVRRLHDVGKSGWMVLVGLIPLVGAIWLLILMATEGQTGGNCFGPDPKTSPEEFTDTRKLKSAGIALTVASSITLLSVLLGMRSTPPLFLVQLIVPCGLMLATGIALIGSGERERARTALWLLLIASGITMFLNFGSMIHMTQNEFDGVYIVHTLVYSLFYIALALMAASLLFSLQSRAFVRGSALAAIILAGITLLLRVRVLEQGVHFDDLQEITNLLGLISPVAYMVLAWTFFSKKEQPAKAGLLPEQPVQPAPAAPLAKVTVQVFYERNNRGMRVSNMEQSISYWIVERMNNPRKDPFVYYVFKSEPDARSALLELPFIHAAVDTGNLICDELFRFGYFAVTNNGQLTGEYDAFIAGADFTHDMWEKTHAAFALHNGTKKNDLEPDKNTAATRSTPMAGNAQNVTYVRKNTDGRSTWMTYKASKKADAMAFLSEQQITRPLYYVVVETPEGNFGKDKDGFYQE